MLRENDSRYRLEPIGTGLGIGLERGSRKILITPINNLMASIELLSSRKMFLVPLMIVVSHGDDFTPVI